MEAAFKKCRIHNSQDHGQSTGNIVWFFSSIGASPTESSLRQDARDAQWKAPAAPRIPASSLPVADLNISGALSVYTDNVFFMPKCL